jgi:hypothetical protein
MTAACTKFTQWSILFIHMYITSWRRVRAPNERICVLVAMLGILFSFFSGKGRVAWYIQGLCFNQGTRSGLIIGDVGFCPLIISRFTQSCRYYSVFSSIDISRRSTASISPTGAYLLIRSLAIERGVAERRKENSLEEESGAVCLPKPTEDRRFPIEVNRH